MVLWATARTLRNLLLMLKLFFIHVYIFVGALLCNNLNIQKNQTSPGLQLGLALFQGIHNRQNRLFVLPSLNQGTQAL